jgi:diguanylate cyclase (GGDEF)-like protein
MNQQNVLIIGGGRRGLACVEILSEEKGINIVAVIDVNPNASGIKLAQRLGIKTDLVWEKYIENDSPPDTVLNLTDNEEIQKSLLEMTRGKNIEILGEITHRFLSNLLVERQVQAELHRVSQKIAANIGLEELLILILSSCVKSTKSDGGVILMQDEGTGEWGVKSNWRISDETGKVLFDRAYQRLSSWKEKEEAMPLLDDPSQDAPPELKTALCAPLRSRGNIIGAVIVANNDCSKLFNPVSRRLLSTFADHSAVAIENILLYKKSQHLSITDGLTGVYNYRYFQEQLKTELSRAHRYDLNFSLIIVDLDNFKEINDTYGHLKGDEILKKASSFLKKTVRESDTVARYGGDEFVILLPEALKKDSQNVGERIRKGISGSLGADTPVYASIGVSAYPDDGVYAEDLIKKADSALYKAKQEGRNKVCTA